MSLKHATLGLLSFGPASGYDLLQTFKGSLVNVWPATQSQLYGELGKLAGAELVEVAAEGARGRKEYAITEAGLAELRHWLVEVEPTSVRRSDMLLRVFFLGELPPRQAEGYLRGRAAAAAELEAGYRALGEQIGHKTSPLAVYGRVALEWGLRFAEMQREWAEWAVREVTAANVEAAGAPEITG
ncbi:PadR family transcriptional regulator [Amycolatopsis sp. H20-H5]|uniref:PadR family transcriptional regulator n=1 Tax=Amycolatopsis sp. H20-H5 TaxID=3046309 RepID=UPI002DB72363|nr:PadR family transcriptional regulator [Amycolatopsis sp. H20-H5]MEC3982257.1 PadR family transcriptional regulator [Amycolatopsis sp. H20-H5]